MPRSLVRNFGTSLDFSGSSTNKVVAPYTFPTDAFTVTFWYKTKTFGALGLSSGVFGNAEGWFFQAGSLQFNRQGPNDVQLYAYLNAPNDFATPRRLRFRNFNHPNGDGRWHHRAYVIYVESGSAKCDEYEDGYKLGSTHTVDYTGDTNSPSGDLNIGISNSLNFNGLMDKVKIFNSRLTAADVLLDYTTSNPSVSPNSEWNFNEGAGSTVADSGVGANHGTITGAVFSNDTPSKLRKQVGNNLINNGDFEYAPPFTAPTTNANRWIDGTASGSTTNDLFGWAEFLTAGTSSCYIDNTVSHSGTSSLKLSTSATGSSIQTSNIRTTSPASEVFKYGIPATPNTSYTCTFWLKTNYVSGDSNDGAYLLITERNSTTGGTVVDQASTKVKTTTDWTKYTMVFTTASTTAYLNVRPLITGSNGAGTLIMDAWFDDITLTPTVNTQRQLVRDFGTSLKFDGVADKVQCMNAPSSALENNFVVATWFKATSISTGRHVMVGNPTFRISRNKDAIAFTTTGVKDYLSDVKIVPGVWYHYAVYFDGANDATFYINGVQVDYVTGTAPANTTVGQLAIGFNTGAEYFDGYIDEPMMWIPTNATNEIAALYYNGVVPNNLKFRYTFDEGTGTTTADVSGNGNTGTITTATFSNDVPSKPRFKVRDFGTSLTFNSSSNPIQVPDASSLRFGAAQNFTITAWIKPTGNTIRYFIRKGGGATLYALRVEGNNLFSALIGDGSVTTVTSTTKVNNNEWSHVAATFDRTGVVTLYLNGLAVKTGTISTVGNTDTSAVLTLGGYAGITEIFIGSLDEVMLFGRLLSQSEIKELYTSGTYTSTNLVGLWKLDEGAGTTANDTSGNANHGTITGATFSSDVPSKPRKKIDANLVFNGDFEYAPPFTATTNTSPRWIDGTATGSTTNDLFKWYFNKSGSGEARFDNSVSHSSTYSMKLSTTAPSSWIELKSDGAVAYNAAAGFLLQPNTAYTLTYWLKTNYVSGDSGGGANLFILYQKANGSASGSTSGTYIKTTTDWTQYTINFTTASDTYWGHVEPRIYGHTGSGTLIMDAWFDDITLLPS